eukprot:15352503-Ditylum_brightwellii.AAC.1
MTEETVLNIVRKHRQPGMEDPPFANVKWAMDNWLMSKPLYDKLLRLRQYPYGTMELKRHVMPFVTFGGTKKPTNATPNGSLKKVCSVENKCILYLQEALDVGFKWAVKELKQKKNGIHTNIQNCIQLSPSRVPSEYHLTFKSTKLHKNHNQ